jgi:enolase
MRLCPPLIWLVFKPGGDVYLALDCAASEFYRDGKYHLSGEARSFDSNGFSDYLAGLVSAYPILSIEDGLDEGDWGRLAVFDG